MRAFMVSYFVQDGNLTCLAIAFLLLIGFSIMGTSLYFFENQNLRLIGASFGLAISSIGGYGARAKTLGLRPFDGSYKKARKSYAKSNKEQEKN